MKKKIFLKYQERNTVNLTFLSRVFECYKRYKLKKKYLLRKKNLFSIDIQYTNIIKNEDKMFLLLIKIKKKTKLAVNFKIKKKNLKL